MIRSRTAASRTPAAPLRGRCALHDPAARSPEPAPIRDKEGTEHAFRQARNRPHTESGQLRDRTNAGKPQVRRHPYATVRSRYPLRVEIEATVSHRAYRG